MKQRQCVLLVGERHWCEKSSKQLLSDIAPKNLICLSEHAFNTFPTLAVKQTKTILGHEFDALIFDATKTLCPDSLGISIGTIRAGGVLILCLAHDEKPRLWSTRFRRILDRYIEKTASFYCVEQGASLPSISLPIRDEVELIEYQTHDQQVAINAIYKVAHGHRRRPLVLSADRGRGKSAALGIAAASLLGDGKQTILVTAPSFSVAETVFKHAALALPKAEQSRGLIQLSGAEIRFVAPDVLIESTQQADLLLVDEAAAIPATMLEKLLKQYARVVFSSTLHGYEGTGRGFSVRFKQLLDLHSPGWRGYHMLKPIRWLEDDPLEAMSFDALLLNAEPVERHLITGACTEHCVIEQLDKQTLLDDEAMLQQLFGLMVLAHYRTRPSDLKMLLDRDDMSVYVVRYQGDIVGSAWVVDEGGLSVDLAKAIYRGERRLAGHLLPQSLLVHAGLQSAGGLSYRRIIRIVIHPALHRKGLATSLMTRLADDCRRDNIDLLGTSFSLDADLLAFWRQAQFQPVRLGVQRDDVSGRHALLMLRSNSEAGNNVLTALTQRFAQQWQILLSTQFSTLETPLVLALSKQSTLKSEPLSDWDWQDVDTFAHEARSYESCQVTLIQFMGMMLAKQCLDALSEKQQQLVVMLLIQRQPLATVIDKTGCSGKKELITALRVAMRSLLALCDDYK